MKCPQCNSSNVRKDGHQDSKQRWKCKDCRRIFRDSYEQRGYHPQVKEICLNMYLNGMGFRAIERVTGIHYITIMNWVKESASELPEDELQTYMGRRSNKVWLGIAINYYRSGVLAIQIGDRSGKTFEKLWERVKKWDSRRYLTDGYCVYANYIEPEKQAVLPKKKLTRVEGENTRLRHYLARLHQDTLCYSKSLKMLWCSI